MRKYVVLFATAGMLLALSAQAAQAGTGGQQPPAGVVKPTPPRNLPHLQANTSEVEQVRQLVKCGGTMYAVGTFTAVVKGSTHYTRHNIFSFSATAPYTVRSWAPNVVGPYGTTRNGSDVVNTIAFVNGNCSYAYIGGKFTSVDGTRVHNIAKISTSTGKVVTSFAHSASGTVQTIVGSRGHLLVGGQFTSINGDSSDRYMVGLNPRTGRSDGFVHLHIYGNYKYSGVSPNSTRVFGQQLSPGGVRDLVEGDFTSVGGKARQQAFILNVGGTRAWVTGWNAPEFRTHCVVKEPFYVRDGAWSPNGSKVFFGTTGYHVNGLPAGSYPRTGPCDAALAFASSAGRRHAIWTNYTGCDSLYSAAADGKAAYFGGHERWSMNPRGCNFKGPGAYRAPGMQGVNPATGALYINSSGTAGYYSRGRGLGADNMLMTKAGLWIASDNFDGTQYCGGVSTSGICFLPH